MFETAAIPTGATGQRMWSLGMGVAGQAIVAVCAIAIPLLSPAVLPRPQAIFAWLEAPSLPRPEPTRSEIPPSVARAVPSQMQDGVLHQPVETPTTVKDIEDPPLPPGLSLDFAIRSASRVSELVGATAPQRAIAPPAAPPVTERAAPAPQPAAPIRLRQGGNIVAAVPIRRVEPVYPLIAIRTRVSGKVELEAVIGTDGRIHELKALSGPALLIPAAVSAVKEWVYQPYLLNGDPIEVVQTIIVTFSLK